MKITVINGTEVRGCTYQMKELFLAPLRENNSITEFFMPKDMPHACSGCKKCFIDDAAKCPHYLMIDPIWASMMDADLLLFTAPVYGLGIPGGLKALLDHFCVRWMVHRPEPAMFSKRAAIITNSIGPSFMARSSQRDLANALSWMGVSKICRCGIGLIEGVIWNELSIKRRRRIEKKVKHLALKHMTARPVGKSVKTKFKFTFCKLIHKAVLKKEETPSADNRHWIDHGWIAAKK